MHICVFIVRFWWGVGQKMFYLYNTYILIKHPSPSMTTPAEITHDLYKYLSQYQVLPNTLKYKPSGNFELDARSQQQLQCGYLITKLLTVLAAEKAIKLNTPLMSSIKNSNTPASRVYNWNILTQGFAKIGVMLAKERQKEITSGNFNALVLFLLDVQNKGNQKKIQKSASTPSADPGLDIKKVHKYEEIAQSQTVLQFMIILIMKTMGLNSKQAVATLAQSAKYLAHMIVKGVKNSFEEIVNFIEETRSLMDKIMYLAEKDAEKNLEFLLQIFKPTLISRDPDVAKAGSLLFKSLAYETSKYNSKNILYQILCKEGEGFDFLYMGLKRHPYLNFQIFDFLFPLMQGTLQDFLDVQFKRTINNQQQYIKAIILLLEPLLQNKQAKSQISKSGLLSQWQKNLDSTSTSKLKGKDPNLLNEQTKYHYIQLMYTVWMGYYKDFQPTYAEELLIKVTQELKKNTRSQVYTIRIPSLLKLFNLLQYLAANRNKLAALLYKKIIFLFVQNHNQQQMRQIVLQNLTLTIQKFPTIPLQFLLEPMLKQLTSKQGTTYILNMYDFEFIIQLCKHPKMQEYYAITFLDYFIKLYTKSVIYSKLIFRVIEAITARFCQSEQIREYCLRSTDVSLNNYGMLVMGKTKGNKGQYNVQKGQQKQEQILNNQKKSLIIELIKHFITLEHRELTEEIKEKVASLFIDWYQNRNHYDKGLAAILMQIGDIQDILIEFKQKNRESEKTEEVQSNQFYSKATDSGRAERNTDRRVDSNLAKYFNEEGDRSTPQLQDIGLGYKKKKLDIPNKYQYLASRNRNVKPDPKVLEDIEKIKQKWRLDQSRAKLEQQQAKKDRIGKINEVQLLQRNLSLGYAKLPELNNDQILFEFDSVKKKHLKDTLDLINLQSEQERQLKSFLNIIQRYQKYIKSLFINYASKSGPMSDNKQLNILSFTEIMRMLKDKGLLTKIPKIAINQIITTINQKRKKQRNVLGGVYEQDFPTFILYFTDLLLQQDVENKKDEPYGLKVQKIILKMLQGQKNVKQLFDPKILKLKQELEYNENIQIPQDLKKVKETQIELDYVIREDCHIDNSFLDCYEIVDGLVYEAVGVHIISPITQLKQKFTLARVFKNPLMKVASSQSVDKKLDRSGTEEGENSNGMLQKDILADSHNSFTKPLKKLSKNLIKKKTQSQRHVGVEQLAAKQAEQVQRDKKRQIHAQKLKQQILKMREQKQKVEAEKREKDKLEQEKKKKKQQLRQQYLEQNKRKLKQKKQQDQKKAQEQKRIEKENKQKRKAEVKAKQGQMLEKQRKLIEAKKQKLAQKAKQAQFKQKQKQKLVKNKSTDKLLGQMKVSAADQRMKDLLIKNSMENGQIKELIEKNKKNFEDLFEIYWNWEKQKIELKNLAQMFKDLDSSKYIYPKQIADVYKSVAKGQLLSLQNFIECIVKLSYRSEEIQSETKKSGKKKQNQPSQTQKPNANKVDPAQFEFMLKLLKMNEPNYKQTIIRIKNQKQGK